MIDKQAKKARLEELQAEVKSLLNDTMITPAMFNARLDAIMEIGTSMPAARAADGLRSGPSGRDRAMVWERLPHLSLHGS